MTESAFPKLTRMWDSDRQQYDYDMASGMTLRDYFAAKALVGLYACDAMHPDDPGPWTDDDMARLAYRQADAMLKAREA